MRDVIKRLIPEVVLNHSDFFELPSRNHMRYFQDFTFPVNGMNGESFLKKIVHLQMLFFEDKNGKITAFTTIENGEIREEYFSFDEKRHQYWLNFESITKDMTKGSKFVGSLFYASQEGLRNNDRYADIFYTEFVDIPFKACQHYIDENRR